MFGPLAIIISISALMITFGVDQLIRPEKWINYLPGFVHMMPFSDEAVMQAHAAGNVLVGMLLLAPILPILSVIVALIWWLSILPAAYKENWRIGARDTAITIALLSLLI